MAVDLTGGIDAAREFVFPAQPVDREMRESVNVWMWDEGVGFGMPRVGKFLACFFCVAAVGGSLTIFQVQQSYSQLNAATGFDHAFVYGLIVAVWIGIVLFGGVRRIVKWTDKLSPFMCLLYVLACLVVLAANYANVPAALLTIVREAFAPEAVLALEERAQRHGRHDQAQLDQAVHRESELRGRAAAIGEQEHQPPGLARRPAHLERPQREPVDRAVRGPSRRAARPHAREQENQDGAKGHDPDIAPAVRLSQ